MRIENHVLLEIIVGRLCQTLVSQRLGLAPASLRQQRNAGAVPHSGDISAVAPPVPIPNTAVKRCSPDGSTATGRARVGRRQNKNPGEFISSGFSLFGVAYSSRERSGWEPRDRRSSPRGQRVSDRE